MNLGKPRFSIAEMNLMNLKARNSKAVDEAIAAKLNCTAEDSEVEDEKIAAEFDRLEEKELLKISRALAKSNHYPFYQTTKSNRTLSTFGGIQRFFEDLDLTYLLRQVIKIGMKLFMELNVRQTALLSRLIVLGLEVTARLIFTGHSNDGFKTTAWDELEGGILDSIIKQTLGGFANWDGQYFQHIAALGYTHANTIAFFPLFPIGIGLLSTITQHLFLKILSLESFVLLIGWIFNTWCFQNAATVLGELVRKRVRPEQVAFILPTVTYLFCFNPASIFFSAFYSESLFAWLTFSCILALCERKFYRAIIFASLGAVCRSNGLLNFGFVGIAIIAQFVSSQFMERKPKPNNPAASSLARSENSGISYMLSVLDVIRLICYSVLGLMPFLTFQFYCIWRFCSQEYSRQIGTVLPFCQTYGLPYNYIQHSNWGVGFLRYFEVKQIPNFLLATPVLLTLFANSLHRFRAYGREIFLLKQLHYKNFLEFGMNGHGLFLSVFCFFCIHVQVSTRMIFSSCPYIYLYIAENLRIEKLHFLKRTISWTPHNMFINFWFTIYFVIGTILFSLGYPWT